MMMYTNKNLRNDGILELKKLGSLKIMYIDENNKKS